MNIDRFKHEHLDILTGIAELRRLTHAGVTDNAWATSANRDSEMLPVPASS